jgi:hypothetical protein
MVSCLQGERSSGEKLASEFCTRSWASGEHCHNHAFAHDRVDRISTAFVPGGQYGSFARRIDGYLNLLPERNVSMRYLQRNKPID